MNRLIGYAADFASFALERIDLAQIRKVILFGSVARGENDSESDVDLFFDTNSKAVEKHMQGILSEYYASLRFKQYWALKGIKNRINPVVGDLNSWPDLHSSIASNSIVLYGAYLKPQKKQNLLVMLSWENIRPESKRVVISRKLFGFRSGKKRYPGLVEKGNAVRASKGSILVPHESQNEFIRLFRDKGVAVKIRQISEIA